MKYFIAPLLLFLISYGICPAQPAALFTKAIDSTLLVNAHAVKRLQQDELIVYDLDKALFKSKQVYTITSTKGDNFLSFVFYTDKFLKLEDFNLTTYNALGIPTKVYTKKDLKKDAFSGNLVDDNTNYRLYLTSDSYPITAECTYALRFKGILNYPAFDIQSPNESVVSAQFKATIPKRLGLRYFNQHTNIQPEVVELGENITYTWQAENLPAFKEEKGSVADASKYPRILMAPNQFKMDDYAGDMSSWQNFGKWYGELAAKASDLSDNSKATLRALVAHTTDPIEKTRIIYHYLQQNFRYVSIQLGIGGFKPFPASFTHEKKYGDCKALTNYMQACLAAVNVKSYQALVNAGKNNAPVTDSFPVNEFNHVILCVPIEKDSIWLECTSNYTDFNKPGNFTENRNALLITENGGVLVRTPASTSYNNRALSKETILLNDDGSGTAAAVLENSGEYKFQFLHWLRNESLNDQKQAILYYLDLPSPEKLDLQLSDDIRADFLKTSFAIQLEKIPAMKAGSKMFLNKHLFKIWQDAMPADKVRKADYYFEYPFEKSDTTVYQLPAGFKIESLPRQVHFDNKYAVYESNTWQDASSGNIITVSSLALKQHHIPAADYEATRKFFSQVIEDEIQKIIITKG